MGGQHFKVEWQMERFNLSEKEAEEKIQKIKDNIKPAYTYSIKWQMEKYGISEEEAKIKIENLKNKTRDIFKNMSDFDFKSMSSKNKEHWMKKGYTEKEAILLSNDQVKYMQSCFTKKRLENPEKYKDTYSTKIEYWIKKGLSKDEAKEKIAKNQSTFSLKKCIEKYGLKEGRKKWEERQIKWQNTLNNKTEEEKNKINNRKIPNLENFIRKYGEIKGLEKYNLMLQNFRGYSTISQNIFYILLEQIEEKGKVKFATHNGEKIISHNKRNFFFDFCYNDKIIEFNGDVWHANPQMYKKLDYPHPYKKKLSAEEIWKYDEEKNQLAKNKGYDILIIWEKDYKENKENVINECIKFLKCKKN